MESEFPGNSISKKKAPEPKEKKIESIVSEDRVVRRRQSLSKRFSQTFFSGESARSVIASVFRDVVVPAIQDNIVDAGTEALERAVHGSSGGRGRRSVSRGAVNQFGHRVVNYAAASSGTPSKADRATLSRKARTMHKFDEVILPTRVEALEVLEGLRDIIAQYESATVKDFYTLINVAGDYTDEKWGWTDLSDADVMHTRHGYLIDLPQPELLD